MLDPSPEGNKYFPKDIILTNVTNIDPNAPFVDNLTPDIIGLDNSNSNSN